MRKLRIHLNQEEVLGVLEVSHQRGMIKYILLVPYV